MNEKRYYQRDFEELYYIIDSHKISEKEFDEKEMYDGYSAFEDSMTGEEIVDLLNENDCLKQQVEWHKERIRILSELLDLADMIIDLSDDEKAKESWGNKNRSLELKWKEVLKKYGKGDVE